MPNPNILRKIIFPGAAKAILPTDLANLAVWLRADLGVSTPNSAVSQWDFENGTFRGVSNVAQGTGANQPTHVVSDAAYNNQSTISFDGNDYLDGANFSSDIAQPSTYFVVGDYGAGNDTFIDRAGGVNRNVVGLNSTSKYQAFAGTPLLSAGNDDLAPHIIETLFNGAASEILVDGGSVVSGNAGAAGLSSLRVGDNIVLSGGLTGTIAEIIIYKANVSAANRTLIRNYLNTRYAIF